MKLLIASTLLTFLSESSGFTAHHSHFHNSTVGAPVKTSSGVIYGHASSNRASVSEYLGIPFAKPPVGDLRFEPPQLSADNDIFNASSYGSVCPQKRGQTNGSALASVGYVLAEAGVQRLKIGNAEGVPMDEDCLTLNVWTKADGRKDKAVLLFVYGGGFQGGQSSGPLTPGEFLADDQDIVVVSANYRTNVFGFPGLPGRDQNLGLLDQRLAVEWIRDNIAAFGGCPSKITILGQSAGSASVDYYSYAWTADPIVAGFIEGSGTVTSFQYPPSDNLDAWHNLTAALNCGNNSTSINESITCVRTKPWEDLISALPSGGLALGAFSPSVDNRTVYSAPAYRQKSAAGEFIHAPYLIGNNDYEAGLFKESLAETGRTLPDVFWDFFNLAVFTCSSRIAADARANAGVPVWRYRYFGEYPNTQLTVTPPSKAYHGSEIPLYFGTTEAYGLDVAGEKDVSTYMMRAWAGFVRDPEKGLDGGAVTWPGFDGLGKSLIRLAFQGNEADFADSAGYDALCPGIDALLEAVGGAGNLGGLVGGSGGGQGELLQLLKKYNLTSLLGE